MPAPTQPSAIAREVLHLLATRRMPPTPANFRTLYHEVAEIPDDEARFPENLVRSLAGELPRDTVERIRLARKIDQAIAERNPDAAQQALTQYAKQRRLDEPPAWSDLIANLLRQWEARQLGWTVARKRESLERVLASGDAATLHSRLQAIVRSWSQAPADPEAGTARAPIPPVVPAPTTPAAAAPEVRIVAPAEASETIRALRDLLLLALESVVPALLADQPDLLADVGAFASSVRRAADPDDLDIIGQQLRKFAYRLEMLAGDRAEVHGGLLSLLRLLLENIDQIVIDDRWLHGQVEVLRDVVEKPADVRRIDDAERRLKEVIYKQSQLKHNHSEAQRSLKEMLAGLIDHLAGFAETTSTYHDRIGECAGRIAQARDIGEIGDVLNEVMRETLALRDEARRSRDELHTTRERAREAEARMAQLQQELDESSRLVRHDQLTAVLNRRGFEEIFDKEAAWARRHRSPLSVALLDVDNFKQINDAWGHRTGDGALVHLSGIVRKNLRPQDTLARYGGEEFVLLYPETNLDGAAQALIRLQRELTRELFLFNENRILITFSAGVTEWGEDESVDQVLERADRAMYDAKQSGKNKVVTARPGNAAS
ncbi:MAG: GGDEF domain-containing protein [Aromatoleum sp.]|jgi:diguanylate cyclase|uniref:GGDEF domain-containing protein n=1 Tax=Aromatoleum sp. TaxID=2307007 RepID=UPI0028953AFC|nr:GGDEF domain-containing protein [Aromatoleum sp.]MDT3668874.1 GGDEF domain-containing protein [Aromatoleum sp.]